MASQRREPPSMPAQLSRRRSHRALLPVRFLAAEEWRQNPFVLPYAWATDQV
jgi:hypothetical protein